MGQMPLFAKFSRRRDVFQTWLVLCVVAADGQPQLRLGDALEEGNLLWWQGSVMTEECLTAPLSHDLFFHKMLPLVVGIRQVPVLHFRRPTCVIYSDASYKVSEPSPARLGLVYCTDSVVTPLGLAAGSVILS